MDIKSEELKSQDDELFDHILHLDDGKRLVLSIDIQAIVSKGEK
jgi:hypothetical protein